MSLNDLAKIYHLNDGALSLLQSNDSAELYYKGIIEQQNIIIKRLEYDKSIMETQIYHMSKKIKELYEQLNY